ncbi:hypothetical protein ZIOFF_048747 [Zingiber officinale]|uniref:Cleft lip and palate associated transmembrane protein n=1 Tax=Zingiber officinale TaxID=94328 RepID=A0A8J5KUI2_ZINOF|nr:hypothetical protein ZIOFF_048747 [Zingiber officinale]
MAQPEGRPVVAGEATRQGRPGQQQQQGFGQTLSGIVRMAVFWYFAMKFFGPKKPAEPSQLMSNMLAKGEPLDMWVYLSENEKFKDFGKEDALVWHEANIPYAVWGPSSFRSISLKYYPSEVVVKNNGSLYAHVFFARSGYPPDPNDPEYEPLSTFGRTHSIVTFLPKPKSGKKKSLLGSSKDSEEEESAFQAKDDKQVDTIDESHVEWIPYWKPNVTIDLVDDFTRYSHNQIPPHIAGRIQTFL